MKVIKNSRRGYPLSALFLLITASGVLLAVIAPLARGLSRVGMAAAIEASVMGLIGGAVLGAVIGLHHYARVRGLGWGVFVGGVVGALVTPLVLVSAEDFPALLSAALGSAVVLLGLGTVLRMTAAR